MTVREVYTTVKSMLQSVGIEDAAEEARLLLCHFLHITPADMYVSADKTAGEAEKSILLAAEKRCAHYPLQYILGQWPFMGMDLCVGEGVLIPRDDTEVLVRVVGENLTGRNKPKGLDLCAGTGAVSLGICSLHKKTVIEAVELYPEAFSFLTRNCRAYPQYAVSPIQGDIADPDFCAQFQNNQYAFIASNPPYITGEELQTLQPEIAHEPSSALLAGENGLFFYRIICGLWIEKLVQGGLLAVEIGETQAKSVCALFRDAGLLDIRVHRDLSGHNRCVSGLAP